LWFPIDEVSDRAGDRDRQVEVDTLGHSVVVTTMVLVEPDR